MKSTDPKCDVCKDEMVIWREHKGKLYSSPCTKCLGEWDDNEEITEEVQLDWLGFKV